MLIVCNPWQIYERDFLVFIKEHHKPEYEIQFVWFVEFWFMQIWIYTVYKFEHALNLCSQTVRLCSVTWTAKCDVRYPDKCIANTPALYKI